MSGSMNLALPLVLFGAAFVVAVGGWLLLRGKGGRQRRAAGKVIEMGCSICHKPLSFSTAELQNLPNVERAMAVSANPKLNGRKLAEFVCPFCEAAHCFDVGDAKPAWVGVNLYEPQTATAHCLECGRQLKRPPGQPGVDGKRLTKGPMLQPDYGLVCPFCKAVCCAECCERVTRQRVAGGKVMHSGDLRKELAPGTFVCPRCSRHPVDTLFYP